MSELERRRARRYAMCTCALDYDRVTDGAEGVFDQALTNGLAAIVAREWPGAELDGSRTRSAAALLTEIEQRGKVAGDGVVRVLRPGEPEWIDSPFEAEPTPNFTSVDVKTLRDALDATHAIRHARESGDHSAALLSEGHVEALRELDHHPALFGLTDEMIDRAERSVATADAAEQARDATYWAAIGYQERSRREEIDHADEYAWETKDSRCDVDECPVCRMDAFVALEFDSNLDEIGIGTCVACSYNRGRDVAEDAAITLQISRAMERED